MTDVGTRSGTGGHTGDDANVCLSGQTMRYAESEMPLTDRRQGRSASHASPARSSSSHRTFEPRAMKIDVGERRLLKAAEAGE